jgi:hypothetical protein
MSASGPPAHHLTGGQTMRLYRQPGRNLQHYETRVGKYLFITQKCTDQYNNDHADVLAIDTTTGKHRLIKISKNRENVYVDHLIYKDKLITLTIDWSTTPRTWFLIVYKLLSNGTVRKVSKKKCGTSYVDGLKMDVLLPNEADETGGEKLLLVVSVDEWNSGIRTQTINMQLYDLESLCTEEEDIKPCITVPISIIRDHPIYDVNQEVIDIIHDPADPDIIMIFIKYIIANEQAVRLIRLNANSLTIVGSEYLRIVNNHRADSGVKRVQRWLQM